MSPDPTNLDPVLIDDGDTSTLRFERDLAAPIERVWHAITDAEEMRAWFPSQVLGDRVVGARLTFPFEEDEADTFEGAVIEWDPPRTFAFTWHGDLLRFELIVTDNNTRLTFTQSIHHTTEAARTASGWFVCLAHLDVHLGGPEVDPEAWRSRYLEYLHTMGAPMGVIDGRTVTFERAHFVRPEILRERFAASDDWTGVTAEGIDVSVADLDVEERDWGSIFRVGVHAVDATDAARWHGLLTQLDMVLASGQLVVDERWQERIPAYTDLMG